MGELFELLGEIRDVRVIATGKGVQIRAWLKEKYGGSNWRKLKGVALVRDADSKVYEAEVYWFECHGIGRKLLKTKES